MNTIDIAKQAGFVPAAPFPENNFACVKEHIETFRKLCVAEEHKRLMALGMEPVKIEVTDQYGDAYGYTADQLAAAKLQGADEVMQNQLNLRKYAEELQEKNAQLETQLAQYKVDAERYQWLQDWDKCNGWQDDQIDRQIAIDNAARKEEHDRT